MVRTRHVRRRLVLHVIERLSPVAQIPDEAVKSGKEVSFPARALYQVICAYRNSVSGECYLKDQKRMSAESGISYCHLSTIKRELLTKGWVKYSDSGLLIPIKGTFIKSKVRAGKEEVKAAVDETFTIRNSFTEPKAEAGPLSHNESPSFISSNGTGIADSKEFLFTSTFPPLEPEGMAETDAEKKLGKEMIGVFKTEFRSRKNLPYHDSVNDQVQVGVCIRKYRLSIADWGRAVKNYFVTPKGRHWLADLCDSYDTYFVSALDKYKTPVSANIRGHTVDLKTAKTVAAMDEFIERTSGNGKS